MTSNLGVTERQPHDELLLQTQPIGDSVALFTRMMLENTGTIVVQMWCQSRNARYEGQHWCWCKGMDTRLFHEKGVRMPVELGAFSIASNWSTSSSITSLLGGGNAE